MAKMSNKKVSLIGGNKAAEVNPLRLTRQFKAVCVNEHKVLSPAWRTTRAAAIADAQGHIDQGHYIDFEIRIV